MYNMIQLTMLTISSVLADTVHSNEVALESLRAGILNYSAYARQIQPEIEKKLYKKVRTGTIVTALSRLELKKVPLLRPPVKIEDISIKSPLSEISFDKNLTVIKEINHFHSSITEDHDYFAITQGMGEITMILPQKLIAKALLSINQKPKGQYDNLVAITIRIVESDYVDTPNMIYSLVAALAGQRINLIEIVSTFSEISFIIRQEDMRRTVDIFNDHFGE